MGRRNRGNILFDGCWAHIISRAADKRYIFESTEDFEMFKTLLKESKSKSSYRIHHYCLMHTHFHLAVSMDRAEDFSEAIRWLKMSYSKYFNFKMKRFGPLWRDRFKSLVIEDERYLFACGRYIEGNPVEAGLVKHGTDWPYSSSRHYELGQIDDLVDSYGYGGEPVIVETESSGKFFTEGHAIGSNLFKIYCQEQSLQMEPVPR